MPKFKCWTGSNWLTFDANNADKLGGKSLEEFVLKENIGVDGGIASQEDLSDHVSSYSAHGATSTIVSERIIMRDENGCAQVANPRTSSDIARKAEVDNVQNNLSNHTSSKQTHGIGSGYYIARTNRSDQRVVWEDIYGKPSAFLPSSHSHNSDYYTKTQLNKSGGGGKVHYNNVTSKPAERVRRIYTQSSTPGGSRETGDIWFKPV